MMLKNKFIGMSVLVLGFFAVAGCRGKKDELPKPQAVKNGEAVAGETPATESTLPSDNKSRKADIQKQIKEQTERNAKMANQQQQIVMQQIEMQRNQQRVLQSTLESQRQTQQAIDAARQAGQPGQNR